MTSQDIIEKISLYADSSLRDALAAVDRGALGVAIILYPDTGRFAGVLTDGDLRRSLLDGAGLNTKVKDIKRPNSTFARTTTPREKVINLLSESRRVIPIVDENDVVVDLAVRDSRARLPIINPLLGQEELENVSECILKGWISSAGRFVTQFEEEFAKFCGCKYGVAVSNGTVALHLSLVALGVGLGDEVIVPSLTWISSANAVVHTGAKPVFVDSDRETWNLDPEAVRNAITPRTKAIMPVHLYGHPAKMDQLLEVARSNKLFVIEDAAEAHGARFNEKVVGSFGQVGCFSFYGNKIITTGEGGMIVTDDENLCDRMRCLRDHGKSAQNPYIHSVIGFNYRLTNLQAAVGVAQIKKIDRILADRRRIAKFYDDALKDLPGVRLPPRNKYTQNAWWLYSILVEENARNPNRDRIIEELKNRGIETRPLFRPVHLQPAYYNYRKNLPISERIGRTGISLPTPSLFDRRLLVQTVDGLKAALEELK